MQNPVSLIMDRITKNNNEKTEIQDTIKVLSNKIVILDNVNEDLNAVIAEIEDSFKHDDPVDQDIIKEEVSEEILKIEEHGIVGPEDIVPPEIAKVLMKPYTNKKMPIKKTKHNSTYVSAGSEIIKYLKDENKTLSSEEIFKFISAKFPDLARGTFYNYLSDMVKTGQIKRAYLGHYKAIFKALTPVPEIIIDLLKKTSMTVTDLQKEVSEVREVSSVEFNKALIGLKMDNKIKAKDNGQWELK